jgi:hypothetical protein
MLGLDGRRAQVHNGHTPLLQPDLEHTAYITAYITAATKHTAYITAGPQQAHSRPTAGTRSFTGQARRWRGSLTSSSCGVLGALRRSCSGPSAIAMASRCLGTASSM